MSRFIEWLGAPFEIGHGLLTLAVMVLGGLIPVIVERMRGQKR